jgi:glutamate 5-kinase
LRYGRVVVKAGTNVLTGGTDRLDKAMMGVLTDQVAGMRKDGIEVLLVTSGAVAAGREVLGLRPDQRGIPLRQTQAAVGQSRLMHAYEGLFAQHGVVTAQVLVTRNDLTDRLGYLNARNTINALLELGVVPIVNENDVIGVEELAGETIGDNDHLSSLVASLVDADLLVLLSDIAGLFTADPHRFPDAQLISRVDRIDADIEALAGRSEDSRGRGGMATKLEAARLATAAGVTVVIADGAVPDVLKRLEQGEEIGTFFPPAASKLESRKRWMLSAASRTGSVIIDAGAVEAVLSQHRSLLPAGVTGVKGTFDRGDIVPILGPDGERLACGIANYSSKDVERIKGLRSDRIGDTLGVTYADEVVHRNNLVVL